MNSVQPNQYQVQGNSAVLQGSQQKAPLNVMNLLFLTGAVISAVNCLARADYNLPIFLFAYLAWDINNGSQRLRIIYLFMFSSVVDFFYIIYWGSSISVFTGNFDWLNSVYVFTIIMASILMVLKVVSISDQLQEQVSVQGMADNFTKFLKSDDPHAVLGQPQLGLNNVNYNSNPQQFVPQQVHYEQNINPQDSQHLGKYNY